MQESQFHTDDFDELQILKAIIADKEKVKKIAQVAFQKVDTDNSGYLDKQEVKSVMEKVADDISVPRPTQLEVDEVVLELDENGDGKLDIKEFQVLIEQILTMMVNTLKQGD